MKRIVNPCMCKVSNGRKYNAFCEIEFEDGRLSISGVVGPLGNGNCAGSAGQCVDEIRNGEPKSPWTREMLDEFCDVWDRWHLNDMRPYCEHQKELGWDVLADDNLTKYNYRLKRDALDKQNAAKRAAVDALRSGTTFTPNEEQVMYANLTLGLTLYEPISGAMEPFYEPKKPLYSGGTGFTETVKRGFTRHSECELGILCKPCPVCGYNYGTKWMKEEVPEDVIDWLFELPESKLVPAWV